MVIKYENELKYNGKPLSQTINWCMTERKNEYTNFDELIKYTKNAPCPTMLSRCNMSTINKDERHNKVIIPSRATLNVQSMSPNIRQINIKENGDDILDDLLIQEQTEISLDSDNRAFIRHSLPANLQSENVVLDPEDVYDNVIVY